MYRDTVVNFCLNLDCLVFFRLVDGCLGSSIDLGTDGLEDGRAKRTKVDCTASLVVAGVEIDGLFAIEKKCDQL